MRRPIILTESDKYMATTNMIYTAVSRAKMNCIVIGEEDIFNKSITYSKYRKSKKWSC